MQGEQIQQNQQKLTGIQAVAEMKAMSSASFDLGKFEGRKVRIEKMDVIDMPSQYDPSGSGKVLKIETEAVTSITNMDGQPVEIRASELFNVLKNKKGEIGWSTDSRAKLHKFLVKMKANHPTKLLGREVTVRIRANNEGQQFLGFIV